MKENQRYGGKEEHSGFPELDENQLCELADSVNSEIAGFFQRSFEDVLKTLKDDVGDHILSRWALFAYYTLPDAKRYCYELRKKGPIQALIAYFLSRIVYHISPKSGINVFAWSALNLLKVLRDQTYSTKKSYEEESRQIILELLALPLTVRNQYDQILLNQIRHYQVEILASEDHLAAAFEERQGQYLKNPENLEAMRAFGWTLHDCIKQSIEKLKNKRLVTFFSDELRKITYPPELKESDPVLINCQKSDLNKAEEFINGTGEIRARIQANDLSTALALTLNLLSSDRKNIKFHRLLGDIYGRMSRPRESIEEYEYCLDNDPRDVRLQASLAWQIGKFISQSIQRIYEDSFDKKSYLLCCRCLKCLDKLPDLERPSRVYSFLLHNFSRFIILGRKEVPPDLAKDFLSFVKQWDFHNLTEEDFQESPVKEKPAGTHPSTAENLSQALYYAAIAKDKETGLCLITQSPFVFDYFEFFLKKVPKSIWAPYRYGKLLIEGGRYQDARDQLIPYIQNNMDVFWVWNILGQAFPQDQDKQIACYCKALLCGQNIQNKKFLGPIHEKLGDLLRERGENERALCEYLQSKKREVLAARNPFTLNSEIFKWAQGITPIKTNAEFYSSHADEAEDIVISQLPCFAGVLIDHFTDRQHGKKMVKIWWEGDGEETGQKTVPITSEALSDSSPGTPLTIWVKKEGEKLAVRKIIKRQDGELWDIYPKTLGILVTQDKGRGYSWFSTGSGDSSVSGDWQKFPEMEKYAIGDFFNLGVTMRKNGRKVACFCAPTEEPNPLPSFLKRFSGILEIPENRSFGFVGDIFLSESIINGHGSGETLSGIAVLSYDRTKQRDGWKAVKISGS